MKRIIPILLLVLLLHSCFVDDWFGDNGFYVYERMDYYGSGDTIVNTALYELDGLNLKRWYTYEDTSNYTEFIYDEHGNIVKEINHPSLVYRACEYQQLCSDLYVLKSESIYRADTLSNIRYYDLCEDTLKRWNSEHTYYDKYMIYDEYGNMTADLSVIWESIVAKRLYTYQRLINDTYVVASQDFYNRGVKSSIVKTYSVDGLVHTEYTPSSKIMTTINSTYDEFGNMIKRETYNSDNELKGRVCFTYQLVNP